MPRAPRQNPGGVVYHVLNRGVGNLRLFEKPADYAVFEQVLAEALDKHPTRILAYVLMPSHWHFVVWPEADGGLSAFLRWLTHTHTMRWHAQHHSAGSGHLYRGRFKSFPIEADQHLATVCRYVERNPLRARLVRRAENWRWSSLGRRVHGDKEPRPFLSAWPVPRKRNWLAYVNQPANVAEVEAVRHAVRRGSPFGTSDWQLRIAARLGLQHTLRPIGRPRKAAVETGAG